jgi:hypothetical protein
MYNSARISQRDHLLIASRYLHISLTQNGLSLPCLKVIPFGINDGVGKRVLLKANPVGIREKPNFHLINKQNDLSSTIISHPHLTLLTYDFSRRIECILQSSHSSFRRSATERARGVGASFPYTRLKSCCNELLATKEKSVKST